MKTPHANIWTTNNLCPRALCQKKLINNNTQNKREENNDGLLATKEVCQKITHGSALSQLKEKKKEKRKRFCMPPSLFHYKIF